MAGSVEACAVDTQAWVDPPQQSALVNNFAQAHILVSLFDGDPDKWIGFIQSNGTLAERKNDLPFVRALKARLRNEPLLMKDLRRIVREFSAIVAS
jgi:hypothetical protein